MSREYYDVSASIGGKGYEDYIYTQDGDRRENPQSFEDWHKQNVVEFKVMADCHEQHIWSETELVGVSKTGTKKLDALKARGYKFGVTAGGRSISLIGWR